VDPEKDEDFLRKYRQGRGERVVLCGMNEGFEGGGGKRRKKKEEVERRKAKKNHLTKTLPGSRFRNGRR
jgi:hypothetical protein